jgi:DNA-binding CsgD family transcriptional regulator
MQKSESLALATSLIHRSRSLDELQKTFLSVVPKFIHADVYGMYLFDDNLNTETTFSYQANPKFLNEYENIRNNDPLLNNLLQKKRFTHSLGMFNRQEWFRQPLHGFLSQWGLNYSIEAPLVVDGHVKGTLNFARGGYDYFEQDSLTLARFLCNEVDFVYNSIIELDTLKTESTLSNVSSNITACLSSRALEVLELAICGLTNRIISRRLGISENTVRHYLKQIYKTLGVHNRAQLVQRVNSERLLEKTT